MQVSKAIKVMLLVCALAFAVFAATNNGKPKKETPKAKNQPAACCRKDGQKAANHAQTADAQAPESCAMKTASAKKDSCCGSGCCGGGCCQAGKSAAHGAHHQAGGDSCCTGGACCSGDSCQSQQGSAATPSGEKKAASDGCACCAGGACSMKKKA